MQLKAEDIIVKRIPLSLILALALASGVSAQTVSVDGTSGQCGQGATVPVSITSVSGLLSLEFRIAYDTSRLTLTSVSAGSVTSGFAMSYNAAGGVVSVAMASGTGTSGQGTVASLTFSVADAATGVVPLAISNVRVNDAVREGSSGALTVTCLQPPLAAENVSPANGASGVQAPVTLRWNAGDRATGYNVQFGTSPSPRFFTRTTRTSVSVPTEPGTTYYWSVEATNAAGSAGGATSSFTTGGASCAAPGRPQLTAPPTVTSNDSFELVWTDVPGATEYVVDESENVSFEPASATSVAATRLTLTRTAAGERAIYFRVRARNATDPCNVDGAPSAVAEVRIVPRPALVPGTRVIPAVASADGALGSFFRTSVQLHNAGQGRISGLLVFHPAGVAGTSSDPSMPYVLEAGETRSYGDIVGAIGVGRGLGSLDLVPNSGSNAPLSVVRVFNDGGASGTSGSTFDPLVVSDAIAAGQRGILLAPMTPARARMNIGIRTLLDGATLSISVRDRLGATIQTSRVSYPSTYFVQQSLSEFTGNAVLLGDEVIVIEVESGAAMVYGSTTDNVTQDPSVQIARPLS